ncbi:unnamed protein product [Polarella glacialis]|uniref:ABC transporter domain-containing protein n=1 Tax=Polarella glacialis TaxID=89957 RepID=A0A813G2B6_POLGL|nr:unnamed protein product [Polarella glacialis]
MGGLDKTVSETGSGAAPMEVEQVPSLECKGLTYRYGGGAYVGARGFSEPKLIDVTCNFAAGSRVLVVGGNGAGKSTLLSVLGGKKMVDRDQCKVLGKAAFHDSTLNGQRMYCGDWWRTDFFFNITVGELIGEKWLNTPRVQELIDIMQINTSWRINAVSDGQRRRCHLLECLAEEKKVYILDEITTDLDLFAREGLLRFLQRESDEKGATIFYATHIFDHLAEWATHLLFLTKGKVERSSSLKDLVEFQQLVAQKVQCPLYTLMKDWISQSYDAVVEPDKQGLGPELAQVDGAVLETKNLTYAYGGCTNPQLKDVSFSFGRGAKILVVGANGAGKSTLLSILGGKRMIPRGFASIMGKDCFNDMGVGKEVMYCGDWWRTKFFMNLTFGELLGEEMANSTRCKHLADVLQVSLDWKINEVSDGMRRRCQLIEALSVPRAVYLMDEITSDLDLFAREGILKFLQAECEIRGATIFYCTHIFDHLEGWASHLLHMSQGEVLRYCPFEEVTEYAQMIADGDSTPLYSLVRKWIYSEYDASEEAQPWRKVISTADGRMPALGLAGPFMMTSGG